MGQAEGSLGAQLEERYFRQKVKLGEGSFGTVWRAIDRQSGETVAIKQVDKESMPRRNVSRQDIEREITIMRIFNHANIIKLLDTFEDPMTIYLALEYCDGGDFGDKIRQQGLDLDEKELAMWVRQMCDAVCVLHTQNICHRDIKPENFMVHNKTVLKLSDFGLATFVQKGQLLQGFYGTRAFNAPEQHPSVLSPGYSLPVDMWALGVSMYMIMFGGKHPFVDEFDQLQEHSLLTGILDFRDRRSVSGFLGLEGLGGTGLRFSEDARMLCQRMVDADPLRRITASEVIYSPWFNIGNMPQKPPTPFVLGSMGSAPSWLMPRPCVAVFPARCHIRAMTPALATRVRGA